MFCQVVWKHEECGVADFIPNMCADHFWFHWWKNVKI